MAEHTQALQSRRVWAFHPHTEKVVCALLRPEYFGDKDAIEFVSGDRSFHLADDIAWEEIQCQN